MEINNPNQFVLQKAAEALYKLAYDQDVRVMLSGEGAENHVLGSQYVFDSLIRHLRLRNLFNRLRIIYSQQSLRSNISHLIRYGLIPLLPGSFSRPPYYKWLHHGLYSFHIPDWFKSSFVTRIRHQISEQRDRLKQFPRFLEWARQIEYESLNPCNPVLGMPFPLPMERRFPYHDRRLIEFCLAIPPEQKYQHLKSSRKGSIRGRAIQYQAFAGILPDEIRQSQVKVNFNEIYRRRFIQFKEAYIQMFAPPTIPLITKYGYVDREKFWHVSSAAIQEAENSQHDNPLLWLRINRTTQLEIWLQTLARAKRVRKAQGSPMMSKLYQKIT